MKRGSCIVLLLFVVLFFCEKKEPIKKEKVDLSTQVKKEFVRTWKAYKEFAWGHDVLLPISKSYQDWYEESLHISPIDAYSTMKVMGLDTMALEVENFVVDSVDWDKDLFVKTFEVNIRILGGLLAMYEYTGNEQVLEKVEDFGRRMLAAFDSPTGLPYYWFNLKTGEAKGEKVNVAEAGSYLLEMGVLSYYTENPVYYQTAKKANLAIWERVSELKLVGEVINVETGEWLNKGSHICAGIDSYYEYLIKSYILFGDNEIKKIWDESVHVVNRYLREERDSLLWYKRVNMETGEKIMTPLDEKNPKHLTGNIITLYDAFFPAVLALNGDLENAKKNHAAWDWLWNQYGLEPMVYDFAEKVPTYPVYDLNPEIIESAYYLYHITKDKKYFKRTVKYWRDVLKYCKTDVAFSSVKDVTTMEKKDYMATFFLAETLKYFYLAFIEDKGTFNLDDYVFNTEAHPFKKTSFDKTLMNARLGIKQ